MPTRFSLARMLPALLRPAALGLLLCGGLPVTAATFCVGTGDELSQILDGPGANAANNGQDDFILLRTGRFTSEAGAIGGVNWFFQSAEGRTLSISGGWNSNCTTQSTDPTATVLEATNQRLGFILLAQDLDGSSQFSISNLTLSKGRSVNAATIMADMATALRMSVLGASGTIVAVENVIMTGGTAASNATNSMVAKVKLSGSGTLRFRNNVVYANNLSGAAGTSNVDIATDTNAIGLVSNNSIFGNVASSNSAGLDGSGVLTLNNNVLAENTSTSPTGADQLGYVTPSGNISGLTLVNNHITSRAASPVPPFSEVNTTTGATMWSGAGPFRIPDVGSPLRDSGNNSPAGGLSATDARGLPRVINTVVDRGAVEAQPPANTGPVISDLDPLVNSTTTLAATSDPVQTTRVFFFTQSGNGSGQTTMNCDVTAGNGVVVIRPVQTVSNGGLALPVDVALDNPVAGSGNVQATLVCEVFRENASVYTLTYFFVVRDPQLFRNGVE